MRTRQPLVGGAGAPSAVQLGSGVGAGEGGEGAPERGVDLYDELEGLGAK